MKYRTLLIAVAAFSAPLLPLHAQLSFGGAPLGLKKDHGLPKAPVEVMAPVDAAALLAEDALRVAKGIKGPFRFGYNHMVDLGTDNSGVWHELPNGDGVWRLGIECPEAFSINFEFHDFVVPAGGKVYVYNDQGEHIGAFEAGSNPGFTTLGVTQLSGDRITIEYVEPAAVRGQGILRVNQVTHAYRDVFSTAKGLGDSGSCNNNVICPVGDPWRDQIRSVAIITVGGSGQCTGTLINNCSEDGTAYFLTARHCIPGSQNISNWVYRFNWDSPSCPLNQNGPTTQTLSGSTLLTTNAGSDMALIRINTAPPASYNVFYSGWDRGTSPPTSSVAIHHPSGDVKKISFDEQAAVPGNYGAAQCWRILNWEDGTTEPGSSGSGLWNQNGHLVGQLYGGTANCSNNIDDYYGRFDVSWTQLSSHLGSCGPVLDGYDPNNNEPLAYDAALQSINGVPAQLCNQNTITPSVTIRNNGTVTLTSVAITYQATGGSPATSNWTGSLASGAQVNHTLPNITLPNGNATLTVTASLPNGQADENPANNTSTQSILVATPGEQVTLNITLDDYGSETTWQLATNTGTVLFNGGPYQDNQDQTVVSANWCLPHGCYTFTMFDEWEDGICCEYGNGSFQITGTQGVLVNNNGVFEASTASNFCVGVVGVDELSEAGDFVLAPNPTDGLLNIRLTSALPEAGHLVVYDAVGRVLTQQQLPQGLDRMEIDLRDLGPGVHLVELVVGGMRSVKRVVLTR